MTRIEQIQRFLPLRLGFQKKARMLRELIDFSSPPKESVALTLLASSESLHPAEISTRMGVSRARVSQLLQKLMEKDLVSLTAGKSDKRSKEVRITAKGKRTLESLALVNNRISRSLASAISENEQARFISYMKRFADGLGAPTIRPKPGEFPLIAEQSRIAAATGTIGTNYMNTGRPVSEIHTLLQIEKTPDIAFGELAQAIPLDLSSISRQLSKLVKQKLVVKKNEPGNKKAIYLSLTAAGSEEVVRILNLVNKQHAAALKTFTDLEISEFCDFLALIDDAAPEELLSGTLKVEICSGTESFHRARKFLVETLVEREQHGTLSANLLPQSSFVVLLRSDNEVNGVCELLPHKQTLRLGQFICNEEGLRKLFFLKSIKLASILCKTNLLILNKEECPEDFQIDLGLTDSQSANVDTLDLLISPAYSYEASNSTDF